MFLAIAALLATATFVNCEEEAVADNEPEAAAEAAAAAEKPAAAKPAAAAATASLDQYAELAQEYLTKTTESAKGKFRRAPC